MLLSVHSVVQQHGNTSDHVAFNRLTQGAQIGLWKWVYLGNPHELIAGVNLLIHQRLGWRHKYNLALHKSMYHQLPSTSFTCMQRHKYHSQQQDRQMWRADRVLENAIHKMDIRQYSKLSLRSLSKLMCNAVRQFCFVYCQLSQLSEL